MLIHLDCTIGELETCPAELRDEAVRGLLRAHRLGDHVVVISRELCRRLIEIADLSNSDRAILQRIAHDYTQRADLVRKAPRYILASPNPIKSSGRSIPVTFDHLISTRILERAVLLVENIRRDGLLYGELINAHHDLHDCPIPSYEAMHGGGADLGAVFVEQIQRERIVCGIVDTDRCSPDSSSAPKLEALRRISEQMNWPLAFAISPPCREAENCLPMDLMMSLQSGTTNASNHLYIKIADHEASQKEDCKRAFWLFVDLKEGFSKETIGKLTNPKDRDWVAEKLQAMGLDIEKQSVAGFGSKVFDQLAAHSIHLADLRRATRCNAWRDIFFEFVDYLLWIFAGGRRVVT
jgi:hypothetical protein